MSTIVTRAGKGSTLTFAEVDANFTNLNTDKLEFSSEPVRHSVRPSLLLDFANTKQLDPRITFTRASTATFYDGRTTAKAEENLVLYSQEFDNAYWAKNAATITSNSSVAPDGTSTAEKISVNTSNAQHYAIRETISPVGTVCTLSVYVKAGEITWCLLTDIQTNGVYINLSTGAQGTAFGSPSNILIVNAGNGWYRLSFTCTSASANAGWGIYAAPADNTSTFAGANSTDGFFVWGAQLERRSSVTAYTPTTTAAITNYIPALQTAASGVARFDHNPTTGESLGLLIEEQRVNLLTYSEDFSNAAWNAFGTKTVTTNSTIAPDGTLSADYLSSPDNNGMQQTISISASTAYTYSIYAKAYVGTSIRMSYTTTGGTGTTVAVNTVISTGQAVGNGWFRIPITFTSAVGNTGVVIRVQTDTTAGIFIWGAQLEAGAFATSYIPTVASQVTRSPDAASLTGTNFSSWYRADEGTVYTETFNAQTVPSGTFPGVWRMNDGANNNRISLYITSAATYVGVVRGGSAQGTTVNIITTANTSLKNAYVYKSKDLAMSTNAGTVATVSSGEIPILTQFLLSSGDEAGRQLWHKKIAYYPKRLTNAELQGLTTV